MNIVEKNNLQTFLEDLKSADLVGISFQHPLRLRLEFTFGPEARDVAIELSQIVHFSFSQALDSDDPDYCFWVGKVELRKIESSDDRVISKLAYPFPNGNGQIDLGSLPLLYFHLEGDIAIDVVCRYYQIFQELKAKIALSQ